MSLQSIGPFQLLEELGRGAMGARKADEAGGDRLPHKLCSYTLSS
jgi:hypothetical protein